jgi:DNA-binding Lrp family transcriptional regulator
MAAIVEYQARDGYCTASYRTLAGKVGCSVRTAGSLVRQLGQDGILFIKLRYRKKSRGRTSNRIEVNWEHSLWVGCHQKAGQPGESGAVLKAKSKEDSVPENTQRALTAVPITDHEACEPELPGAVASSPSSPEAEPETPQAEKCEVPEVTEALEALEVHRVVAVREARRYTAARAMVILAIVLSILKRGRIRNPAGLALAAFRDPDRYVAADRVARRARPAPSVRSAPVRYVAAPGDLLEPLDTGPCARCQDTGVEVVERYGELREVACGCACGDARTATAYKPTAYKPTAYKPRSSE